MFGVLIVTHYRLADEFLQAVQLIVGCGRLAIHRALTDIGVLGGGVITPDHHFFDIVNVFAGLLG